MILVNTVLVSCYSFFIGDFYCCLGYWRLDDLILLHVWCMWYLDVVTDSGRSLVIRLIVILVHIVKYQFLMDWRRV